MNGTFYSAGDVAKDLNSSPQGSLQPATSAQNTSYKACWGGRSKLLLAAKTPEDCSRMLQSPWQNGKCHLNQGHFSSLQQSLVRRLLIWTFEIRSTKDGDTCVGSIMHKKNLGVLVDYKPQMSQRCDAAAKVENEILAKVYQPNCKKYWYCCIQL